ncbi:MAG: 3-oxoacyl-[acyl-carrier-protein] synthase II [bacterium]|jgi:3-oxoacyl-[acyl-carrier-protein] synthase II
MYIKASSTISHQPTFKNPGFSKVIKPLPAQSDAVDPEYRDYISANSRRRLSPVLKMALACAQECVNQSGGAISEAIIVGTGMGSNHHTTTFLDKIYEAEGGLVSPTSFTLSTANSIAGQISIQQKNHGYNNTHSHSTLSFEQALIDSSLCLLEGMKNVLIGAADEYVQSLFNMPKYLGRDDDFNTNGASFFSVIGEKTHAGQIQMVDVASLSRISSSAIGKEITSFLNLHANLPVDLVLFSSSNHETHPILKDIFPNTELKDIVPYCGVYLTNSAFAVDYAVDMLSQPQADTNDKPVQTILVCNNLLEQNLGLILLTNITV